MTASSFSKADVGVYVPTQETITLWFVRKETHDEVEVDKPLFWVDVRADITFAERERMQAAISDLSEPIKQRLREENLARNEADRFTDAQIDRQASLEVEIQDLWDVMAPFVLAWSVGEVVDGKPVPVPPPSEAGGQQFRHIHDSFTGRIWLHLWTRSQGDVDVDFLGRSKRSAKASSNGATAVKSAET